MKKKLGPFKYLTGPPGIAVKLRYSSKAKVLKDLSKYIGNWRRDKQGIREGKGIMTWIDGSVYNGWWKNNMRFGHGRLIEASGDAYQGNWNENKRHG